MKTPNQTLCNFSLNAHYTKVKLYGHVHIISRSRFYWSKSGCVILLPWKRKNYNATCKTFGHSFSRNVKDIKMIFSVNGNHTMVYAMNTQFLDNLSHASFISKNVVLKGMPTKIAQIENLMYSLHRASKNTPAQKIL